jgi:ubiquinone/menaquinone biosynthesis C-methylase UbiE
MLEICKKKYKNYQFKLCDARDMKIFKNNSFDFVMFSANGIDHIPHEGRYQALQEIKRVCRSGGIFCFSAHNLRNIDKLFSLQISKNPIYMIRNIRKYILFRTANKSPSELKKENYVVINAYEYRVKTYYIKPEEQLKQLTDLGFKDIRLFALEDGREIKDTSELISVKDNSIYYLCEA